MHAFFDVLIVGAGFFGAVCAHELARLGFRCLVLERRFHIGGNCYTDERDGVHVHAYGPHIFHTSSEKVWAFVNRFAEFNGYRHRVKVSYRGTLYSFPPNLVTFQELWGVRTAAEARARLERMRIPNADTDSLEGWALSQLGRELYEIFIEGYTTKQWGKPPAELPASILKRIPLRFTADDSYFNDPYQGIPRGGYTSIFEKLLAGIPVWLGTDYFDDRRRFDALAPRIVYTGPIDRFFDYRFGRLEYRTMRLEHARLELARFQEPAIVNYTEEQVPYTRIVEHKNFDPREGSPLTWITREYPGMGDAELEPMYPIRDAVNRGIFERYEALTRRPEHARFTFGGRLAEYQYYDMHQVIAAALKVSAAIAREAGRCVAI